MLACPNWSRTHLRYPLEPSLPGGADAGKGLKLFSGSMNTQLAGGFSIRPTPESTDANFLIDVDRRPAELEGP